MSLALTEHEMPTPVGPRRVLVATPTRHIRAGHEKLAELRRSLATSGVDTEIVEYLEARPPGTFSVFVFRGRAPDDSGSWRFSEELSEDERFELSYRMWRSQQPLNRFCAARGVYDSVYVEWSEHEVEAFAAAAERIRWELREAGELRPRPDTIEARVRRLNLWLSERHQFFMSMRIESLIERILPHRIARLDGRVEVVQELLAGLPPEAINGRDAFLV